MLFFHRFQCHLCLPLIIFECHNVNISNVYNIPIIIFISNFFSENMVIFSEITSQFWTINDSKKKGHDKRYHYNNQCFINIIINNYANRYRLVWLNYAKFLFSQLNELSFIFIYIIVGVYLELRCIFRYLLHLLCLVNPVGTSKNMSTVKKSLTLFRRN